MLNLDNDKDLEIAATKVADALLAQKQQSVYSDVTKEMLDEVDSFMKRLLAEDQRSLNSSKHKSISSSEEVLNLKCGSDREFEASTVVNAVLAPKKSSLLSKHEKAVLTDFSRHTLSDNVVKDLEDFAKRLVEEEFKQKSIKNSLIPSGYHPATEEKELIDSATIKDLLAENDRHPEFTHREEHLAATKAQGDSEITRCYASTVELRTKSEHFKENNTFYRQWVLFKDFKFIAKDKKIKFEDSVDYAINFCDVSIRCSCPDFLYRGYSYMGDQLGYLYGIPREKRFPKKNNPNLRLSSCKHASMALEHILKNKENIIKMFGHYYKRLEETPPDTMIAIPSSVVREKKEETLDDFLKGFDEDGNVLPVSEEEQVPDEEKVEIISSTDPDTGVINVDTKLAEGELPLEEQVKYAGEEDKPVDEETVESVAGSVSDEEVEEIATQIDEADTFSSYTPLNSGKRIGIMSMASDGFKNHMEVQAWMNKIVSAVQKRVSVKVGLTFAENGLLSEDGSHSIKASFTAGSKSKELVFTERVINGILVLYVYVDSNEIFFVQDGVRLNRSHSYKMLDVLTRG